MQDPLAPIRQNPFGLFPLQAVPAGLGSPDRYNQAYLTGLQRTRNQVLQDLHELVLRHLRVHIDAKASMQILLGGEHFSQPAFVSPAVLAKAQRYAYDLDELTRASDDSADISRQSILEPIPRVPNEGDSGHIRRAGEALTRAGIRFQIVGGLDSPGQSWGHVTLVVHSLLGARMWLRRAGFLETRESRCVLLDSRSG